VDRLQLANYTARLRRRDRIEMKIVLGLDGSLGSKRALHWVVEHGPALDARVSAVLVVPRVELWGLAALQVDSGPVLAELRAHLEGDWTEPLRAAGLRVTTRLGRGDPATELCKLAEAREADLLVIGAKSRSAVYDLLGGTAHKIANHARVPVVLVPAPAEARLPKHPGSATSLVRPLL
jgi:nucleotide-binding universal stress UspA family protein